VCGYVPRGLRLRAPWFASTGHDLLINRKKQHRTLAIFFCDFGGSVNDRMAPFSIQLDFPLKTKQDARNFFCFDFGGVLTTEWLSLPMKENRTLSVGARDADA
jgi:hypothetical protein